MPSLDKAQRSSQSTPHLPPVRVGFDTVENEWGLQSTANLFYGVSTLKNRKNYLPTRKRVGQTQVLSKQLQFRRDLGIASFTLPGPCAHVYDTLPPKYKPDFFKLYAKIKNEKESLLALTEQPGDSSPGHWQDGCTSAERTYSSEVMVASILTKSPPMINKDLFCG